MNLEKDALELFHRNRRIKDGYQFTVPSPGTYPYQWLWDSCFHAIVLSILEPDAAKKEIRSLISRQFADGMIPHVIFWKQGLLRPYEWGWGKQDTSSITQPPMLAYAAWEIHRRSPDKAFLEEIYPALMSFYTFLIEKRDPRHNHVIGMINPDESGEDNSPRFDPPMGVPASVSFAKHYLLRHNLVVANRKCNFDAGKCMRETFWAKDVPFNVIMIRNLQALAHIASFLGHKAGERYALMHQDYIKEGVREKLFADGVFWNAWGPDYELVKIATWSHFIPLFADLYTKEEAAALMDREFANEKTFRSQFGIRTVSKTEPSYSSRNFWRGPIWFAPHWFLYKGLRAYGYKDEARFLTKANTALLERHGFREYFNPETGEAYGAKNFTWGALTLDMLED